MPHLKITPFDIESLHTIINKSKVITFMATSLKDANILFGIYYKNEEFLLQLKIDSSEYMLKYDKVSRPLNVNILKEALDEVSKALSFNVLSSNIAISSTKLVPSSQYLKKIKDFENISYLKDSISIEVGFGSGKHILYQAEKYPDRLFIGIEIHTPSAQQLLKQIDIKGLDNIWVLNYDARLFLEMLPSNMCHEIFVHFPVPWDKKPHRRVISKSFLYESMRVLALDGRLELRTDSDNYFWYALETFFSKPKIEVSVRKNEALEVTSKYEARWLRQEKDIYDIYVKSTEISDTKEDVLDFSFNDVKYIKGIESLLSKKALVFDDYFIHFERIFKISDCEIIIKCAFGSFDRPEHKYILLGSSFCRYYASVPVKTKVNYKAHIKLKEQFIQQKGVL